MNAHFERARVLLEQNRSAEAEKELRAFVAAEPNDAGGYFLLASALLAQGKLEAAHQAASKSVSLEPDWSRGHWIVGSVLVERRRFQEAQRCFEEAIRLDPEEADYWGSMAQVHLNAERWEDALEQANRGLRCDAHHVDCANLRALALNQLGRGGEAIDQTRSTLSRAPEDAGTHVVHGWSLLRGGNPAEALTHFREALRLNPTLDLARGGMVEAIKARHGAYRQLLAFFFWMSTLSPGARWGVILGVFLLGRTARVLAKTFPEGAPYFLPIVALVALFAMLTWVAAPVANLVLRLHRDGRWALSAEQTQAANLIGLCLAGSVGSVLVALFSRSLELGLGGLVLWLLMIPISAAFQCEPGWPRRVMAGLCLVIFFAGLGGAVLMHVTGKPVDPSAVPMLRKIGAVCLGIALLGGMSAPWLGNALVDVQPRK